MTRRVLIVANRTASTPRLLDEVARRAKAEPTEFTLLIPDRKGDDWTPEAALSLLSRAARAPVGHLAGGPDPFADIQAAVREQRCDEIIVSTPPRRLRRDLIHRVKGLGVPVTPIVPRRRSITDAAAESGDVRRNMLGGLGGGGL